MRALLLLASIGAHVGVVLLTPRGEPSPAAPERTVDPTPIELVDPVALETIEPELVPEPTELEPEPVLEPPELEPEPAPPEPPPPPKARPRPSPVPLETGGGLPVGEVEGPPREEPPDQADGPSDAPRRLGLTLSNRASGGSGKGSGQGSGKGGGRGGSPEPKTSRCAEAKTKPRPLHKVAVPYTKQARAERIEGRLVLRATVDATGTVTEVEVVQSLGEAVDGPAAAALRAWTFDPATACGTPVEGRFTIARDFALGD